MADQGFASGQTVEDLGRAVKAKYPAYAGSSDVEVGRAVREKYPQAYGDFRDLPPESVTAPAQPPQPSAGERFASSAGQAMNPLPALKMAGNAVASPFQGKQAMQDSGMELKRALIDPQREMFEKSGEALREGKLLDWVGYSMAGILPGAGPQIMGGYEQMKRGDVAGGLGTWAGTLATLGIGEGMSKASGALRKVAPAVYRGGLRFPEGDSLADRRSVVNRGLGRAEPPGSPPDAPMAASEKSLGKINQREAKVKSEVKSEVSKATARNQTIDREYILRPIEELAARFEKSANPDHAKPLRGLIDEFRAKQPDFITPDAVQELKENTDAVLNDSVFAEGAKQKGTAGGEKAMRTGMQKMLEEVAPVQQLNKAIQLDISLKGAINTALKNKPSLIHQMTPWVIGETALNLFAPGHPTMGGAILVGGLVRAAMSRPEAMTRLGIMLDRAGVKVPPAVSKMARVGPSISASGQNAQSRREVNIQVDKIMNDFLGIR